MLELPRLPYPEDALAPLMSAETLRLHHGRHHKAYVGKTNELAAAAGLSGLALEDLVREAQRRGQRPLFNNAAQAWNHAFFWRSMRPPGGAGPDGALDDAVGRFGGLGALKDAFVTEGAGHFASGWVWIVSRGGALEIVSTHDADNPLVRDGGYPLLACDLWEHAYYVDHRNDRKAFLEAWFDGLANWTFAAEQLDASEGRGGGFAYPLPVAAPGRPDRREPSQHRT